MENNAHRNFIEKCLKKALSNLEKDKETQVYMDYERDTKGLMGTPDISSSIFDKIDKCVLFVCDISIINQNSPDRKTPNPNVLMELGYAAKRLGWDNIICMYNITSGTIEDLPFDLRHKRITAYDSTVENESKRITAILEENIKSLYIKGKLFNPLNDYIKGKIDKALLEICKRLSNILFSTVSLSDGLKQTKDMLKLSYEEINVILKNEEIPLFLVLNTYSQIGIELHDVLKDLLSSSYFPKEWSYTVLKIIDWIRRYDFYVSKRNPQYPFDVIDRDAPNYSVIAADKINPSNPVNSKIVLENIYIDGEKCIDLERGRVINTTQYPGSPMDLCKYTKIKTLAIKMFSKKIYEFICLCNNWLDETDSEFILDPESYYIY